MKERGWTMLIGMIILTAFIIPFTLFRNIEKWYGSFLFWTVSALIVIVCNILLTKDWSNEE